MLSFLDISSLGILPIRVGMLKAEENNSVYSGELRLQPYFLLRLYLSKVFSEGNDEPETVPTCAEILPHYVVGIDLSTLCKTMPESSYHLKFLPSVGLRGRISHLFRQKNSDQKIGNKKRFPCLRCAFCGWKFFIGRNYLFSQDKYLDLMFKISIWNSIKNKLIALNILLYNCLVGTWNQNPVGMLDWSFFHPSPTLKYHLTTFLSLTRMTARTS